MMKLKDVSRFFNRTPVYDADTGGFLFNGQINNYDGSHRDAHAAFRRILSVAPGTVMPASGAVSVLGEVWIVAAPQFDGLAEKHRQRHVMQKASGKIEISTIADYLEGKTTNSIWGDVQWVVGTKEREYSSDSPQIYDIYLMGDHDLPPHRVAVSNGRLYLGQFQFDSAAGYTVYRTLRQDKGGKDTVEVITRKHDPALGRAVEVTRSGVPCLAVRWQEFFSYTEQMSTKHDLGDRVFLFLPSTDITPQTRIKAQGRSWSVQSIQTIDGIKAVHGRPA